MQVRIDTSEDKRLAKLLETASKLQVRALSRLVRTIAKASTEVADAAVKLRFNTGKGPFPVSEHKLGVKSGRLRHTIRATKPQLNLRTGEISVSFGSNMAYFAVHEFGFQGQVGVKQHTRRLLGEAKVNSRGKLTKKYQERLKKVLAGRHFDGAKTKTATQVRAHTRRVKVPARAPLGTQLHDRTTSAAFLRALRNALEPLLREM